MIIAALLQLAMLDAACIDLADLGSAIAEAHERGVPLEQSMTVLDKMRDNEFMYNLTRRMIVEVYQIPRTGQPINRREFTDMVAAQCMAKLGDK